jgi:hypothetical protein
MGIMHRAETCRTKEDVDPMYYVMTFILLFPWSLLAVMIGGHLRARWTRKS